MARLESKLAFEENDDANEAGPTGNEIFAVAPAGRPSARRPGFGPGRSGARQAWVVSEPTSEGDVLGEAENQDTGRIITCFKIGLKSEVGENEDERWEVGVDENYGSTKDYEDPIFGTDEAAAQPLQPPPRAAQRPPITWHRLRMQPPKPRAGWEEQEPKSRFINGRLTRASKYTPRVQLRALEEAP